jgi:hypothetical protein
MLAILDSEEAFQLTSVCEFQQPVGQDFAFDVE